MKKFLKLLAFMLISVNLSFATQEVSQKVSNEDKIISLYVAYYNRAPDYAGLEFWKDAMANLKDQDAMAVLYEISKGFAAHEQFSKMYKDLRDGDFLDKVYNNILGTDPDKEGKEFWYLQLVRDELTRVEFMAQFVQSALTYDATLPNSTLTEKEKEDAKLRQKLLTNKVKVAKLFTQTLKEKANPSQAQLDDDAAYKASIGILLGVTTEESSVTQASNLVKEVKSDPKAVEKILTKTKFEEKTDKPEKEKEEEVDDEPYYPTPSPILTFSSSTPANDATGINTTANTIVLNFNTNINPALDKSAIKFKVGNGDFQDVNSIVVSGKTITATLVNENLDPDTKYTIKLTSDIQSNDNLSLTGAPKEISFTTNDGVAPTIYATSPTVGEKGYIPVSNSTSAISLSFNESVNLTTADVELKDITDPQNPTDVPFTFNYAVGVDTCFIRAANASTIFNKDNKNFELTLKNSIKDDSGTAFAGKKYLLKTNDTSAPTIISVKNSKGEVVTSSSNQDNNDQDNNETFTITFSEAIKESSLANGIKVADKNTDSYDVEKTLDPNDNKVVKITLKENNVYEDNNGYSIEITKNQLEDLAGNKFASDESYNFTAIDNSAPKVTQTTPTDNATNVVVGKKIVVKFNEALVINSTANNNVKVQADTGTNKTLQDVEVSKTELSDQGKTLTITLANNTIDDTNYTISLKNAITDNSVAKNKLKPTSFTFKTKKDEVAPEFQYNRAHLYTQSKTIKVYFTKNMLKTAIENTSNVKVYGSKEVSGEKTININDEKTIESISYDYDVQNKSLTITLDSGVSITPDDVFFVKLTENVVDTARTGNPLSSDNRIIKTEMPN